MPANSAPVCESIRAADGTGNRSAGITTVFREHYKQLGSPVVREFDADNLDRVTAGCRIGSRHRVPSGMQKYDEPFTKRRWAQSDLPTYKAGDAADLKSEAHQLAGRRCQLLLKLVNWVWELETLPTAWSQG
jgi:hypothetical protein